MRLTSTTLVLIALIILIVLIFFSLVFSKLMHQTYYNKLQDQISFSNSLFNWVTHQKSEQIYTFSRPRQRIEYIDAINTSDNEAAHGMKFSQLINVVMGNKNSDFSVRVTSYSPINAENIASQYAMEQLDAWRFRGMSGKDNEAFRIENGVAHLVRPLYHDYKCLVCHESYKDAPANVKAMFKNVVDSGSTSSFAFNPKSGFSFKLNELAGFTEARAKVPSMWVFLYKNYFGVAIAVLTFMAMFVYLFVDKLISSPIRKTSALLLQYSTTDNFNVTPDLIRGYQGEIGELTDSAHRLGLTVKGQIEKITAKDLALKKLYFGADKILEVDEDQHGTSKLIEIYKAGLKHFKNIILSANLKKDN
jgi:hypothetical protein